jgi:hypothetical protein
MRHRSTRHRSTGHRSTALATACALALAVPAAAAPAYADGAVTPILDPPTPTTLGIAVPIPASLPASAAVGVRYRAAGTATWSTGLPLHRVRAATVRNPNQPPPQNQFAGSILDLTPGTAYDVELDFFDGSRHTTVPITARTRPVPAEPAQATAPLRPGTDPDVNGAALQQALKDARPGTVIELDGGTWRGNFFMTPASGGTATDPVVLRGRAGTTATLRGAEDWGEVKPTEHGDFGHPVLNISADYVHVENLTITHGLRGLDFFEHPDGAGGTASVQGAVVRGVTMTDVGYGIASSQNHGPQNAYFCDNTLHGSIPEGGTWDDHTYNSAFKGIMVDSGTVACHNSIDGFGDGVVMQGSEVNAVDVVGNDMDFGYDNGVEADGSYRNVRIYRNRFRNVFMPLSFQPVNGGPVYAFRNVIVNSGSEPFKLHGGVDDQGRPLGDNPNGVLIFNNTSVKAGPALPLNTLATPTDDEIRNNLFIGGDGSTPTVDWNAGHDNVTVNDDGYYPDGPIHFGTGPSYANVAAANAARDEHFESRARAVGRDVFAHLAPWPGWSTHAPATVDVSLSASNPAAHDAGVPLPGINDVPDGRPDLGALEFGCPAPRYGVRPDGPERADPGAADPCTGGTTAPDAVSWTALGHATADGGTLTKNSGDPNLEDAAGVSAQTLDPSGANAVEFSWSRGDREGCVGLVPAGVTPTCAAMPYRLTFQNLDGRLYVAAYRDGVYAAEAYPAPTDRVAIALSGDGVQFAVDGVAFAPRAAGRPAGALHVGAALWNPGSTVADARVTTLTTG